LLLSTDSYNSYNTVDSVTVILMKTS